MPPHPGQPQAPVLVQHQYVAPRMFGPSPINMECPNCRAQVTTATVEDVGIIAWVAAGVMCAIGLWCCMCIPLCMDSLKDVTHRCPSCSAILGRYRQIIISLMVNFQNMKTYFYLNSYCDFWIDRKLNWCYRAFANCVKITISCQKHRNPILQFYTESIDSIRGKKR
jgi:lipopolysaccharide-induced tumor necrosis factor-alpha factor